MLGALALMMALTLSGMSFSHLSVSNRLSNINQARSLAEAVVSRGIEKILSSEGKAFGPNQAVQSLNITLASADGGSGKLTFDKDEAEAQGLPLSTNNIKGETAKTGYGGRIVPEYSVHLIGLGNHNGVERKIEAILRFPAYQFALSSKGQISSEGDLIVAGADDPSDLLPSVSAALARGDLIPGHMASNKSDVGGEFAVALNEGSGKEIRITGDVRANGSIQNSGAQVDGDPRPGSGEVELELVIGPAIALPLVTLGGTVFRPGVRVFEVGSGANAANPDHLKAVRATVDWTHSSISHSLAREAWILSLEE
jgi:hypothetical protein